MSHWVMGIFGGMAALVGLFLASAAVDQGIFVFGLTLVLFGVLFAWWMIKTSFDEAEVADGIRAKASIDPGHLAASAPAATSSSTNLERVA